MSDIRPRPYSKDYEITDAMFGAFRGPDGARGFWSLFGWTTALLTVLYAVALPPIINIYVRTLGGVFDAENNGDPEQALEAVSGFLGLIPWLFVLMIGSLAVLAVIRAAFYRNYFHGEPLSRFPFRFSAGEVRQFLAILGYYALFFVFYVLFMFVVGAIAAATAVAAGEDGLGFMILLMILVYIGFFIGIIWFGITFAPAGALTGLRDKVHVVAARHITKNRFWALFGSLFVAGLIGYIVSYAAMAVGALLGLSGLFSADMFDALSGDNPEAAWSALSNQTQTFGFRMGAFFAILMSAAGYAFFALIVMGPSAFFVKQWAEADPAVQFE